MVYHIFRHNSITAILCLCTILTGIIMFFDWMTFMLEASTLFGRPRAISNAGNWGYGPIDSYIVAQYLRVWYVKGVFPFSIRYIFVRSTGENKFESIQVWWLQIWKWQAKPTQWPASLNCKLPIFGEISQGILKMIFGTHIWERGNI